MSVAEFSIAFAVIFLGTMVQGSIGFGFGLLAAPVLASIDPSLVPPVALLLATVISLAVAWRERTVLQFGSLTWAFVGRVIGTVSAGLLITRLPRDVVVGLLGFTVLFAVAASIAGWRVRRNTGTLVAAGTMSGLMGTMTSIGGPPMALLYQHEEARRLRAALAAYFLVGALLSIGTLTVAGELGRTDLAAAAKLSPGMLLGLVASAVVGDRLPAAATRKAVLVMSTASAIVMLVRAFS